MTDSRYIFDVVPEDGPIERIAFAAQSIVEAEAQLRLDGPKFIGQIASYRLVREEAL